LFFFCFFFSFVFQRRRGAGKTYIKIVRVTHDWTPPVEMGNAGLKLRSGELIGVIEEEAGLFKGDF
jgi:hypothetical protein